MEWKRVQRDPAWRDGVASSAGTTRDKVTITNVADAVTRRRLLAGRPRNPKPMTLNPKT